MCLLNYSSADNEGLISCKEKRRNMIDDQNGMKDETSSKLQ